MCFEEPKKSGVKSCMYSGTISRVRFVPEIAAPPQLVATKAKGTASYNKPSCQNIRNK